MLVKAHTIDLKQKKQIRIDFFLLKIKLDIDTNWLFEKFLPYKFLKCGTQMSTSLDCA